MLQRNKWENSTESCANIIDDKVNLFLARLVSLDNSSKSC